MKFIISIMLVLIFATSSFSAARAVWRSSHDEDTHRKAIVVIDMGEFKDNAFKMNKFVLSCIDGVKVYTTSMDDSVHSIIIPGSCNGKIIPPTVLKPQKPQKQLKKVNKPESKDYFLNW